MKLINHTDENKKYSLVDNFNLNSDYKNILDNFIVLEDKFYKIFDLNPCPMSISDINNKIIYVNNAFLKVLEIKDKNHILNKELDNKILNNKDMCNALYEIYENGHIKNFICNIKTFKGNRIRGLFSGRLILLNDRPHILMMCQIINKNILTNFFKTYFLL